MCCALAMLFSTIKKEKYIDYFFNSVVFYFQTVGHNPLISQEVKEYGHHFSKNDIE